MKIMWTTLIIFSCIFLLFNQNANVLGIATSSIEHALKTCLDLGIIYIFWCGVLQIVEDCGIGKIMANLLSPLLSKLFPNATNEAHSHIALNLSTNMLGISNASLPAGMNALNELNKMNDNENNHNINLFIVLNCISIQIIPTTILSLYSNAGGNDFLVLWICGLVVSVIIASISITFFKLLSKRKSK